MPVWLQVISVILGIIGTLFGIFGISAYVSERMKHRATKKNKEEDEITELKYQKHLEELRAVIREENASIKDDIASIKDNLALNTKGTVTILRNDMKKSLDYCKKQGFVSRSDKINWSELYNTYGELGGNHFREFVNGWKEELEELPVEEHKQVKTKKKVLLEDK